MIGYRKESSFGREWCNRKFYLRVGVESTEVIPGSKSWIMKIKCQNKVNVIINYKKMFVKNFLQIEYQRNQMFDPNYLEAII